VTRSGVLAAAPAALVALLLLVATMYDGAFDVRHWAPVALFALVMLAVLRIRRGTLPVTRPVLVALVAIWAFAAWSFLSISWAESKSLALEGAGRSALYASLVTVAVVTVPGARQMRAIGAALVTGIVVMAVVTLVRMHVDGAEVFVAGRPESPIGYRNAAACLFAIGFWPLIGTAVTRGRNPSFRAACFAAAVLCLGLGFLTQSRGAVIGLALGGVVAIVLSTERIRRSFLALLAMGGVLVLSGPLLVAYRTFENGPGPVTSGDIETATGSLTFLVADAFVVGLLLALLDGGLRASAKNLARARRIAVVGLAVGAIGLVAGGMYATGDPVAFVEEKLLEFQAFESRSSEFSRLLSTGGERYDLWRVAIAEFASSPVTGVGEGSYPFDYYAERQTDRNLDNPHSLPLRLLAELGVVGLLLFATFLAALGVALVRGVRWERLRSWAPHGQLVHTRHAIGGLAAGGAVVIGQSLVDWMWFVPGVMGIGLFALALAAGIASPHPELATQPAPSRRSPPARGPSGGVRGLAGALRSRSADALSGLRQGLPAAGLLTAAIAVLTVFLSDYLLREARTAASPEARVTAASAAERVDPWDVTARYLQASAYESMGDVAAARSELEAALALEPRNFASLGLLGDLETRAGNERRATRLYRQALALNPMDRGLRELAGEAQRRAQVTRPASPSNRGL
jgi:hypothetical protein